VGMKVGQEIEGTHERGDGVDPCIGGSAQAE
jgi:hypothetical protein